MIELTLSHVSKLLTVDVLDKIFKVKTGSDDGVKSVKVTRAAPVGEGLISAVYRIHVNGFTHKATFIAKGLVIDAILQKSLNCQNFFKREGWFFSVILPKLIEVQINLGAKQRIQEYLPHCYSLHIDGENDYILMEDMSEKNAVSLTTNATNKEINMTLKTLAHFHAVSIALRAKQPEVFEKITEGMEGDVYYNEENRDWYAKYLQTALDINKNALADIWKNTHNDYYKKYLNLLDEDYYGQLITLSTTPGDNPAINHGDAWCPNFLCCEDRAIAIDFQLVRCASPATDLCYFMFLCSNLCKSKEDFYDNVKIYHNNMKYYLEDMGLDVENIFSLDVLMDEIKKYGKFGVLAALASFPLLASERHDNMQFDKTKYSDVGRIPLDKLWVLTPMKCEASINTLVNSVRLAVDVGLI